MKKYLSLFAVLLFMIACKKDKRENMRPQNEIFCDTDFDVFYKKFRSDSLYQKEHIKFPLTAGYYEETKDQEVYKVEEYISEANMDRMLTLPSKEISMTDKLEFGESISHVKDTINYSFTRKGTSRIVSYSFVLENDCWFLLKIFDDSLYQPDPFRGSKLKQFVQPLNKPETLNP